MANFSSLQICTCIATCKISAELWVGICILATLLRKIQRKLESYNTNGREYSEIQLMREFLVTNNLVARGLARFQDEQNNILLPIAETTSGGKIPMLNTVIISWKFDM